MFKTETHLHTLEVSVCGKVRANKMVELYHDAGYQTICVSDHVKQSYFDNMGDIPWRDKVAIIFYGYYLAKQAAKKYNMNVIMSAELLLEGTPRNHYLIYGATKKFFLKYPNICKMDICEFSKIAKENGVFVIQAHPYRDGKNIPTPEYVDGFEVYNSNPRHTDYSEDALKTAKDNHLYISAGSDAHREEDVARSGILTEKEIKTAKDLISAIKSGKFQLIGGDSL